MLPASRKPNARRARVLRDDIRLWLRQRHGLRSQYPRAYVTEAAVALGYDKKNDLLLAYAVFAEDRPAELGTSADPPLDPADAGETLGGAAADATIGSIFYPDGDA